MKQMLGRSVDWAEGGVIYGGVVRDLESDVLIRVLRVIN